ncbi:MAG TPA: hypothetical protein VMT67_03060 [Terriglobales bacterium]|nr:hypothetical protein [Terriglobales bacterium]
MNVKQGDMAIVVSAFHVKENIGRIVEVVRPAIHGMDYLSDNNSFTWMVRSSRPLGRVSYQGIFRLSDDYEAPCADENLRPISSIPIDDEVIEELKEPA